MLLSRKSGSLGKTYKDGEVIVRQGEPGKTMFVIQSGEVEVYREDDSSQVVRLAVLKKGEVMGEMALFDRAPRSASVRALGDAVVLTIDKRTLMRRIHEDPALVLRIFENMSQRIRKLNQEVVNYITLYNGLTNDHLAATRGLANLASFVKENETGKSVARVQTLAVRIAKSLRSRGQYVDQIDEAFLANIGMASLLYDVGGAGIPAEIREKKGRLSEEEWRRIKGHVNLGANVLQKVSEQLGGESYLDLAEEMARFHHERYDGRGYLGVSWEKVPLSARVISVVDAFVALTSERPYRESWSMKDALEMIKRDSGTIFDPEVVISFLMEAEAEVGDAKSSPTPAKS